MDTGLDVGGTTQQVRPPGGHGNGVTPVALVEGNATTMSPACGWLENDTEDGERVALNDPAVYSMTAGTDAMS